MSRLAYLAGPVDQVSDYGAGASWAWTRGRAEVEKELNVLGFDVFRPDRAFAPGPASHVIQLANNAVIDVCRAGVVCLPAGVPTLGTVVEIERMLARKIPLLILTDIDQSVQLDVWRQQGVDVCHPNDMSIALLGLGAAVTEQLARPRIGDAIRSLGEAMSRVGASVPLTFEQDAGKYGDWECTLPTRGYPDDSGLDLYVAEATVIAAGEFSDVPCGVKVDIPAGYWGMITGRSSTLRKRNLLVTTGVIDAGWTGGLFAGVQNLGADDAVIAQGDRLAQLILLPAPAVGREPVWGRVPEKPRGSNGFGSTGS